MKIKKRILQIILPIVAIICTIVFIPGCLLWLKPLPNKVQMEVANAINHGMDGIIVYVNQGKETTFYTAGWKNRENKLPTDPHALFKIASISKLYIAVAATKLIYDESLSLDNTLAELMPDLVGRIENAEKITLRMLLKHRSGIPNFTDQKDYPWSNHPKNNRETLALVLNKPADFAPDKKYRYSNTNYLLVGEILDETLGYSHHQYIKQEILTPLGLNDTYSLLSEVDLADVMSGYLVGNDADIKFNDYVTPGGSMIATVQDVGIFLRALNDGSLLMEEEQAIYSSIYSYEHTGLLPGYQSIAKYHKDMDAVVVQFVNTTGGNIWAKSKIVYNRIIKILRK